ncbi:MAG: alpha-glucan family phosphorylase [Nitrospinae bacterium]|nr:alpha-glucan family phosphorylase [Nitrospinota bacterium]
MPNYRRFIVKPSLPEKLKPLSEIAYNLWWVWHPDAINLLRRMDPDLWDRYNHTPTKVLGSISQEKLRELEYDDGFLTHMEHVAQQLREYMAEGTWFDEFAVESWSKKNHVAYFSFEFGLDECLQIYSGGLGVLAGDHLKSASDLGIPVVGVGLAYTHGYFMQYLNRDGWQLEQLPENDFYLLPLKRAKKADGSLIKVEVPFPGRKVTAMVWRAQVGRVPLYLLDTNIAENSPEDRAVTSQLYGGDIEMRIKQEILLGVGGARALEALGLDVSVHHMNEGHAAFASVERILQTMRKYGFSYPEAKEAIMTSTVFTTHTPVPAGNDRFERWLLERYVAPVLENSGVNFSEIMALGRENPADEKELFCMTVLALRLSAASNGVSELHGRVSRKMWRNVWPGVPTESVPILSVTNGVHVRSWISEEMRNLFDRYLGEAWIGKPGEDATWKRIAKIPDSELWRTHERRRERLVEFTRKRLVQQLKRKGGAESEIVEAQNALNPEALTIGFARRFATYKRGSLLLTDEERLAKLLNDKDRPVQIIFAGAAHPRDLEGKNIIKQIIHVSAKEQFRRKIVFLEGYDIDVARHLVQGCDIWLSNPRRPMEASGTSGMKASANGALNLSVLDGWWAEGYSPEVGWAVGAGEEYEDQAIQDSVESRAIYDILERDAIPLFYDKGQDGLPRGWVGKMKASLTKLNAQFNTNRMLREYTERYYLPLGLRWQNYVEANPSVIKSLAAWRRVVEANWKNVRVLEVTADNSSATLKVGDKKLVSAVLSMDGLKPADVVVECYYGQMDNVGDIKDGETAVMEFEGVTGEDKCKFTGAIPCDNAGLFGFAVRVLPSHEHLVHKWLPGLISWG